MTSEEQTEVRHRALMEAAALVRGDVYNERYRKWRFMSGNRSDDDFLVYWADRAADAIEALDHRPEKG